MSKHWKFQEDILIHIWVIAKWLKNCCNNWPTLGNPKSGLPRKGHLLQQFFGYLAINQTKIKISSWNFQHLFITSLCKFDEKILAKTEPACQPRPISPTTLDVSSDCICWDISKRKKLVGFWTHLSALMEVISNIFKKVVFWNFSNECSVQVL